MPRDGSGVYSVPAGTEAVPNTTIESSKYNSFLQDLENDLNAAHPVTAGGTGGTSAGEGLDNLTTSSTIASSGTTNIGAANARRLTVTGTTTITAFDTADAGVERVLVFSGALTLTHNGTSLILPGAANITTVAGDVAKFVSEGSGNWRCASYLSSSGRPVLNNSGTATISLADDGASAGPTLTLDRNSASPAASDVLGQVVFSGRDSGGGTETYGSIYASIEDTTAASEDGRLTFQVVTAGALTQPLSLQGNQVGGSATADATSPSFSWLGDSNTGMYRVAADNIGFATGGVEALRLTNNQFVHLGVDGTAANPALGWISDPNMGIYRAGADQLSFTTAGLQCALFDSNGYVFFPRHNTTAVAANAFINTANGALLRSTSAAKYKRDMQPLTNDFLDRFLQLDAFTYRSAIKTDDQNTRFLGVLADQAHNLGLKELVTYNEAGEVEGFQYERGLAALLEIVKRQDERLKALESVA